MLSAVIAARAQESGTSIERDNLGLQPAMSVTDSLNAIWLKPDTAHARYAPNYRLMRSAAMEQPYTAQPLPLIYDPSKQPYFGGLSGYVTHESMPGLMGIESGALSYTISAGNLSLTPSVYVNKYSYFGGMSTNLGFGGSLTYRISDSFSVTAFGAFYTNAWAANPAVMNYMMSSRYGGYGTWNINNRWGLNVGVQRVQNAATGQWQTVPIVEPTFNLNGAKLGIDVGGILYNICAGSRIGG